MRSEQRGGDVGIGVCRNGDLASGVVAVTIGCPCGADAVESAVEIVLGRNAIGELNDSRLFGNTV